MRLRALLAAVAVLLAVGGPAGAVILDTAEPVRLRSDNWACAGFDLVGALCLEDPWETVPEFDLLRLLESAG